MRLNLRRIFQHSPQHIKIRSTLVFDDIEMPVCLGNPLLSDPADVFETLIGIVCFSAAGGPDVFPQDYLQGAHRRNIPAHVLGHASKVVGMERAKQATACLGCQSPYILIVGVAVGPCPAHIHQRIFGESGKIISCFLERTMIYCYYPDLRSLSNMRQGILK